MIHLISIDELLDLHRMMIDAIGGSHGVRDLSAVDSSLAQPFMTFGGEDLYPTLADKATTLGFSLISNHPFIDGNKRVGHAAMKSFLRLNGQDLIGDIDEQERVILAVAASKMEREEFMEWVRHHIVVFRNVNP
jgi:death-on-curing protein